MPDSRVDTWAFPLVGDSSDMELLVAALRDRDVRVIRRDGAHLLLVPVALLGGQSEKARTVAETHMAILNGVGSFLDIAFRPVSLSRQAFGLTSDGTRVHVAVAIEGAEVRVRMGTPIVAINGVPQADPRQVEAQDLLRAASVNTKAADALTVMGRGLLSWTELYLLFELVESEIGGDIFSRGWIRREDANRFTQTANSYAVLGVHGRHGKDRGHPPANPMALEVARPLIYQLVHEWLRSLGASP